MFTITQNKGFHITFANDITISVQWGPGNYCGNQDMSCKSLLTFHTSTITGVSHPVPPSSTAEIALWDKMGRWLTKRANRALKRPAISSDVIGDLPPDEVARFITWAARQKAS
jgi:hypothetical protein